jgi:hypothetical protein
MGGFQFEAKHFFAPAGRAASPESAAFFDNGTPLVALNRIASPRVILPIR